MIDEIARLQQLLHISNTKLAQLQKKQQTHAAAVTGVKSIHSLNRSKFLKYQETIKQLEYVVLYGASKKDEEIEQIQQEIEELQKKASEWEGIKSLLEGLTHQSNQLIFECGAAEEECESVKKVRSETENTLKNEANVLAKTFERLHEAKDVLLKTQNEYISVVSKIVSAESTQQHKIVQSGNMDNDERFNDEQCAIKELASELVKQVGNLSDSPFQALSSLSDSRSSSIAESLMALKSKISSMEGIVSALSAENTKVQIQKRNCFDEEIREERACIALLKQHAAHFQTACDVINHRLSQFTSVAVCSAVVLFGYFWTR